MKLFKKGYPSPKQGGVVMGDLPVEKKVNSESIAKLGVDQPGKMMLQIGNAEIIMVKLLEEIRDLLRVLAGKEVLKAMSEREQK